LIYVVVHHFVFGLHIRMNMEIIIL